MKNMKLMDSFYSEMMLLQMYTRAHKDHMVELQCIPELHALMNILYVKTCKELK